MKIELGLSVLSKRETLLGFHLTSFQLVKKLTHLK